MTALIELPAEEMGPRMRALNERQRLFARYCYLHPDRHHTIAYRDAGYKASTPASEWQGAHQLATNPRVQAAIKELATHEVISSLPMAMHLLQMILAGDATVNKDAVKVAFGFLDRAGIVPVQKVEVDHNHSIQLTDPDVQAKIAKFANVLGLDKDMLANMIGRKQADKIDLKPQSDGTFTDEDPAETLRRMLRE